MRKNYTIDDFLKIFQLAYRRNWSFHSFWSGGCLRRTWCFVWWSNNSLRTSGYEMFYSDLTFWICSSVSWKSTDGLIIYLGRNGIDLKEKTMVPLKQDNTTNRCITILLNVWCYCFIVAYRQCCMLYLCCWLALSPLFNGWQIKKNYCAGNWIVNWSLGLWFFFEIDMVCN